MNTLIIFIPTSIIQVQVSNNNQQDDDFGQQ